MSVFQYCPLCRMSYREAALMGWYLPNQGGDPIEYELCKSCSHKIACSNDEERAELFYQVEQFCENQ